MASFCELSTQLKETSGYDLGATQASDYLPADFSYCTNERDKCIMAYQPQVAINCQACNLPTSQAFYIDEADADYGHVPGSDCEYKDYYIEKWNNCSSCGGGYKYSYKYKKQQLDEFNKVKDIVNYWYTEELDENSLGYVPKDLINIIFKYQKPLYEFENTPNTIKTSTPICFNTKKLTPNYLIQGNNNFFGIALSEDAKLLVATDNDYCVKLWKADTKGNFSISHQILLTSEMCMTSEESSRGFFNVIMHKKEHLYILHRLSLSRTDCPFSKILHLDMRNGSSGVYYETDKN